MLNLQDTVLLEKKSVFIINFTVIILVILSLLFNISLKYFFYFDVFFTFLLSYYYFKHSKELAKLLIVTNMFIFVYFLYPNVSIYLSELFGAQGYVFIILYNILIAYLFLYFSGYSNGFFGDIKKTNLTIIAIIILVGFTFGLIFTLIKEPIPTIFTSYQGNIVEIIKFLFFSSFLVAFSEQMIFSGFLFNVYSNLTSKTDAFYQTATIFVMFHLLRLEVLVKHYYVNFNDLYLFYLISYYFLLFAFMLTALYFYSLNTSKYKGNFVYPVILHFATDFGLFLFYFLGVF